MKIFCEEINFLKVSVFLIGVRQKLAFFGDQLFVSFCSPNFASKQIQKYFFDKQLFSKFRHKINLNMLLL